MNTTWKPLKNYENLYFISTNGLIFAIGNGTTHIQPHFIKQHPDKYGYLKVRLCKNGVVKNHFVHRLVADTFIPNPFNYPVVNHKNENKTDNRLENLEWCTIGYNTIYSMGKRIMCIETKKIYDSAKTIQRTLGINHSHVLECCKGKQKTAGGYHWCYA